MNNYHYDWIRFLMNDPHDYEGRIERERKRIFQMFETLQYPINEEISNEMKKMYRIYNRIKRRLVRI